MLDNGERATTVTADPYPETLEELADLDRLESEQQARVPLYNQVKLNLQNIRVWLATTKQEDADTNPIPQPDIVIDTPRKPRTTAYPERIGSIWPTVLRPSVPRHPQGYQLALCANCRKHPISLAPVGYFPPELARMCDQCRTLAHQFCSLIYWRHPERKLEHIMSELVLVLHLADDVQN